MVRVAVLRTHLIVGLGLSLASIGHAQDSNYWTYQYGTGANLLGGAVIGSVTDASAAFYNPGALPLIEEPEIILTSKVIDLASLDVQPSLGTQIDLNNLRLDLAPGFIGGRLPFHFLGNDVLGYSLFTRQQFKATMDAGAVGTAGEFEQAPVDDDFFGLIRLFSDLNDYWVGLSYSTLLGTKVGLGATLYGAYRNQKMGSFTQVQTYSDTMQLVLNNETSFSYWNFRMLLKAGVTFEFHGVSTGLTVTTASLSLFGSGHALINRTAVGVPDPTFTATIEDGLGTTFKSPLSIGLGATYSPQETTTIHFSTEYYTRVPQYTVMDLQPFASQSEGDTISVDITDARSDVINFGLGVQERFSRTLTGYASFRTDFTSFDGQNPSEIAFTSWDLYFITAGMAVKVGTADLTAGVAFGWGGEEDKELSSGADDPDFASRRADVRYRTLRLIVAFAI